MTIIQIKKFADGWQYRKINGYSAFAGQTWSHARSIEEIRKGYPGIPLEYLGPDEKTRMTHLQVKYNRKGLVTGTENFDPTKVRSWELSELWPEDSQVKYLRMESIHLPNELTSISDALKYAEENEPGHTLDNFWSEAAQRVKTGLTEKLGPNTEIEIA